MIKLFFIISIICLCEAISDQTYTDMAARKLLSSAGIAVNHPKPKTSLEGVRKRTIESIITFKSVSKCEIVITGGTENGHAASGKYSHAKGYKLDVRSNDCIDNYVKRSFEYAGKRQDGALKYKSKAGNIYARESDHWDITYY